MGNSKAVINPKPTLGRNTLIRLVLIISVLTLASACGEAPADNNGSETRDQTLFGPVADSVRGSCAQGDCHGGFGQRVFILENGAQSTNQEIHDALMVDEKSPLTGLRLVEKGDPEGSDIYNCVQGYVGDDPTGHKRFGPALIENVRDWIAQSAPLDAPTDPTPE